MIKFTSGLILGLMLAVLPANAQEIAPMEIHVQNGVHLSIYECWPMMQSDTQVIIAYINFPEGIASYACFLSQQVEIAPIQQADHYNPRA